MTDKSQLFNHSVGISMKLEDPGGLGSKSSDAAQMTVINIQLKLPSLGSWLACKNLFIKT